MTIERAIEHCKEKEDCTKCGQEHKQLRLWLEELMTLREKQILKKPYYEDEIDLIPVCPCCKESKGLYDYAHGSNDYCSNCGQALDWT